MIINGVGLVIEAPVKDMVATKVKSHGVSYGLSEAGYDIRLKQRVDWIPPDFGRLLMLIEERDFYEDAFFIKEINRAFHGSVWVHEPDGTSKEFIGRTALASSIEEFDIPTNLWGELRNKSSHARKFFDASLGTDMEPGWKGFLTIELIFHGTERLEIPAGSGIAKAVFHELKYHARYEGKYQHQADQPVPTIFE